MPKPCDDGCMLDDVYPEDSGVYWCASEEGKCSNAVNITVAGFLFPNAFLLQTDKVTMKAFHSAFSQKLTFYPQPSVHSARESSACTNSHSCMGDEAVVQFKHGDTSSGIKMTLTPKGNSCQLVNVYTIIVQGTFHFSVKVASLGVVVVPIETGLFKW